VLKIVVWNIQRINNTKASAVGTEIKNTLKRLVGDEPFVVVVLENKGEHDNAVKIATQIMPQNSDIIIVKLGGVANLTENAIVIHKKGTNVTAKTDPNWEVIGKSTFEKLNEANKDANVEKLNVNAEKKAEIHRSVRPSTLKNSLDCFTKRIETLEPLDAQNFRAPFLIEVEWEEGEAPSKVKYSFNFISAHSPGPSHGRDQDIPYAQNYLTAMLTAFEKPNAPAQMLIGDFNVRGEFNVEKYKVKDISEDTGPTTLRIKKQKCEKAPVDSRGDRSRLDRVYLSVSAQFECVVEQDKATTRQQSDHHPMTVTVKAKTGVTGVQPVCFASKSSLGKRQAASMS
jgi:hypothetical protein